MTWGDTFNRHKAKGMDPSAAAFIADRSEPMRRRRLEVENERLREALIQADLTIRSMPGTDQSDVEFIRTALSEQVPRCRDCDGYNCDDGCAYPDNAATPTSQP